MTIGYRLKKLRKDNNYTMDELSNKLNEKYNSNINKSMISKWENDTVEISNSNANLYCKFFNVSLDYLIYGEEKVQTKEEVKTAARNMKTFDRLNKLNEEKRKLVEALIDSYFDDIEDEE